VTGRRSARFQVVVANTSFTGGILKTSKHQRRCRSLDEGKIPSPGLLDSSAQSIEFFSDGDRSGRYRARMPASSGHPSKRFGTRWFRNCWRDARFDLNRLRGRFLSFLERGGDSHSLGEEICGVPPLPVSWSSARPSASSCAVIPPTRSKRWPIGPTNAQWGML